MSARVQPAFRKGCAPYSSSSKRSIVAASAASCCTVTSFGESPLTSPAAGVSAPAWPSKAPSLSPPQDKRHVRRVNSRVFSFDAVAAESQWCANKPHLHR